MKQLIKIVRSAGAHWVGDGFPVQSLFSYDAMGTQMSPFLLLDYAAPTSFPPSGRRAGVGEHPHRGFETVTIVYQGSLEHRDSGGNHGRIGPGDVQWMTAASGVVHEEFHAEEFRRLGGVLEMVQLWVNLPAKHKMSPPRYQEITDARIPSVVLAGGAGTLRVIAGDFNGTPGPVVTVTPVHIWDLRLNAGTSTPLTLPEGYTTALVVLKGSLKLSASETARAAEMALFERAGGGISIECVEDAKALLLCGEPIDEPIVGRGPFVMNTQREIEQAMRDYQSGRMGHLT
ncbi:MAG TPA: pirin family protein [Bryobacteraceae bacterium]|nr:pirin family protein [Bryobacteraceae bacterium]